MIDRNEGKSRDRSRNAFIGIFLARHFQGVRAAIGLSCRHLRRFREERAIGIPFQDLVAEIYAPNPNRLPQYWRRLVLDNDSPDISHPQVLLRRIDRNYPEPANAFIPSLCDIVACQGLEAMVVERTYDENDIRANQQ